MNNRIIYNDIIEKYKNVYDSLSQNLDMNGI